MRPTGILVSLLALATTSLACGGKEPPPATAQNADSTDEPTHWEGASPQPSATAAPPKDDIPPPKPAQDRRTDQYDKDATEVILKRAARQVKEHCGQAKDDDGKATGPWGKLSVTVTLGHNGHSKAVSIPAPFDGKPTGKCVIQAFDNLTFPPWGGSDAQVEWDVELVKPGTESKTKNKVAPQN
jgi:hypothetical protein